MVRTIFAATHKQRYCNYRCDDSRARDAGCGYLLQVELSSSIMSRSVEREDEDDEWENLGFLFTEIQ